MAPVLGYWDIRGLVNPIRLLLEYAGATYEEKRYKCGPPPALERPEWLADKANGLGLDFPNLPYYIDGDVKITQSGVILRHLARKHGLVGKNEADTLRAELLATQIFDYNMDFVRIVYNPEFNKLKEPYEAGLPGKMELLSKFLGNRKFVVGDYITFADFVLFEHLEGQLYFQNDVLANFPVLKQFHERILALEPIDKYYKSDRVIKFPFFGAHAMIGGAYSDQINKQ